MDTLIVNDLQASGLVPQDLAVREAAVPELTNVNVLTRGIKGYVIPYFDVKGQAIPFYRVKLFNHIPKYKQPKGTPNHVYFPPGFINCLGAHIRLCRTRGTRPFVLVGEGEKKAGAAVKAGFPMVSFGGVDSWRNRTVILPEDTTLEQSYGTNSAPKVIKARLPDTNSFVSETATLAVGLADLIALATHNDLTLIIAYDSDVTPGGVGIKTEVQRAAAGLGYELRHRGVPFLNIRQLILPATNGATAKIGMDDYLVHNGAEKLQELIDSIMVRKSAFPRHPNPKAFINSKLQTGKLSRKEIQDVSITVVSELDASGSRLQEAATSTPYYFDDQSKALMKAQLLNDRQEPLHETSFGKHLYKKYGVGSADHRLMMWLATHMTGEPPISDVSPIRVMTRTEIESEEVIAYQISDSEFAVVSGDPDNPIRVVSNGSYNLLFEQGQVEPTDGQQLLDMFRELQQKPLKPWWMDVLKTLNFSGDTDEEIHRNKIHAMLLCYSSPWLNRWRGTQLPIELVIGEANSGKSSMFMLRLSIITGRPLLRNVPNDLRDWHSSVTSTGGLHVIDNVQFTNKDLRQRLSDEMCRITTEPKPYVEMRKLYTTAGHLQLPINVQFGLTAIQQPFYNADLIQRAAIFNLNEIKGARDGDWVLHQLNRFSHLREGSVPGRTIWLAHHLLVLHRFLQLVTREGSWEEGYLAAHRLAHYEQVLRIMGEVFNLDIDWIPELLGEKAAQEISEADWTLEGVRQFAEESGDGQEITAKDIVAWAGGQEDYTNNPLLNDTRKLGRYLVGHKAMLERMAGIYEHGMYANRKVYIIRRHQNIIQRAR